MRRVRYHSHGGPGVLAVEEAAIPEPGPGQVLIRTEAIGVNYVDVQLRRETDPDSIWFRPLPGVLTGARSGVPGAARGAVLVDSVTAWLAAAMDDCGAWDAAGAASGRAGPDMADSAARLAGRTDALVAAWRQAAGYVVAVSDETGLGVVPDTRAGRLFRDELGRLNQRLAAEADEFTVVVAGRPLLTAD